MTYALLGFILATAAYGFALAIALSDHDNIALDVLAGAIGGTACLLLAI